jgi:hypothetical protein
MSHCLGARLRAEVERQLLDDLRHYGINVDGAAFDWSDSCIEGHATSHLGGTLQNFSGVAVLDASGDMLACGWIDFIHGGGTNPLFVFWDHVTVFEGHDPRKQRVLKSTPGIPGHVWAKLPEASKWLCGEAGGYDSAWSRDPLVAEWRRGQKTKFA